ncbi:unnamed protein product [Psylliodes chrysocephalus]|uniref:Mutator-like transposase domain-containing protein n=1 Tax=Psylliodes chrysocephalus TaxID=3402493 RepID=A0A9P0GM40_9CUCU|nr:unnamed protein product [Psylliodes chrysocephala]
MMFLFIRIEEYPLEIEYVKEERTILGCRIVDIDYFMKRSMSLQLKHSKRCTSGYLQLIKEERVGLQSRFILKCNFCEKDLDIYNEEPSNEKSSTLNKAVVWGTLATGSTYSHTDKLFSVLNIPFISKYSFYKIQRELSTVKIS